MFNLNITDITASLAGIAGLGNIISTINNLKQEKYQLEDLLYSLKNYKADIERYFDDAKKIIDLAKNPDQVKADILAEISKIEEQYKTNVHKIRFKRFKKKVL